MKKEMDCMESIKFMDDECGLSWEKQGFSPAEMLAIRLLRPFLAVIGGRMFQMMAVACEHIENKVKS